MHVTVPVETYPVEPDPPCGGGEFGRSHALNVDVGSLPVKVLAVLCNTVTLPEEPFLIRGGPVAARHMDGTADCPGQCVELFPRLRIRDPMAVVVDFPTTA